MKESKFDNFMISHLSLAELSEKKKPFKVTIYFFASIILILIKVYNPEGIHWPTRVWS